MNVREGTRLIAHRGASALAPENTLAAFREAYFCGAPTLELDVERTADGQLVVMHDDTLDRTTDGTGAVSGRTAEYVRDLDAGFWFGPRFAGEPVPTLGEVLDWARGKLVVDIEVKPTAAVPGLEHQLVGLIRSLGAQDAVMVTSFDESFVERVEALAPELKTGLLLPVDPTLGALKTGAVLGLLGGLLGSLAGGQAPWAAAGIAAGCGLLGGLLGRHLSGLKMRQELGEHHVDALLPFWFDVGGGLIQDAHRAGLEVIPYTANAPGLVHRLLAMGADAVITDRPERFAPEGGRVSPSPRGTEGGGRVSPSPRGTEGGGRVSERCRHTLDRLQGLQFASGPGELQITARDAELGQKLRGLLRDQVGEVRLTVDSPDPRSPLQPEDFLTRYGPLLNGLRGVVGLSAPPGGQTCTLYLETERDRRFLGELLRPVVEGRALAFTVLPEVKA